MKLKLFYLCIALFGIASITACSDDDDKNTPPVNPNVPEAVTNAFAQKYPEVNQATVTWEKKGTYLVAEFKSNLNEIDAWFTQSGEWKMTENDYGKDLFMVSTTINQAFIHSGYSTWTIDDISFYEYPDETKNFYMIEVEKAGEPDTQLYFKPDGTSIKTATDTEVNITPDTTI